MDNESSDIRSIYFYVKLYSCTGSENIRVYNTFDMQVHEYRLDDLKKLRNIGNIVIGLHEAIDETQKTVLYKLDKDIYLCIDYRGVLLEESYDTIKNNIEHYYNIRICNGTIQFIEGILRDIPEDCKLLYGIQKFNNKASIAFGYRLKIKIVNRLDKISMELSDIQILNNEKLLKILVIPDIVSKIQPLSFYKLIHDGIFIDKLIIGDGIKAIESLTFAGIRVREVTLGNNVRTIGEKAFCNSLIQNIKFNEGLKSIGRMAFAGCTCKRFIFPSTLVQLGKHSLTYSKSELIDLSKTSITVLNNHELSDIKNSNMVIQLPKCLKTLNTSALPDKKYIAILEYNSTIEIFFKA